MSEPTYRVRILHDSDAENPRTAYDNVGEIISFTRDFRGDRSRHIEDWTPPEFLADVEPLEAGGLALAIRYRDYGSNGCALEVSDEITDRTSALILVDAATIAKEWSEPYANTNDGQTPIERATACLKAEIATYAQWLNGDVYGYVLERGDVCSLGHQHWTAIDSCFGFYGLDVDSNGMKDNLEAEYHAQLAEAAGTPEYTR